MALGKKSQYIWISKLRKPIREALKDKEYTSIAVAVGAVFNIAGFVATEVDKIRIQGRINKKEANQLIKHAYVYMLSYANIKIPGVPRWIVSIGKKIAMRKVLNAMLAGG